MPYYEHLLEAPAVAVDSDDALVRLTLRAIKHHPGMPAITSLIIRQPIDHALNDFLRATPTRLWLSTALGAKHLMLYQPTPSQQWVENLISVLNIPRTKLPCIAFYYRYSPSAFISYWSLPAAADYATVFAEVLRAAEKVQGRFDLKQAPGKIKMRLRLMNMRRRVKGVLLRLTRVASEELAKELTKGQGTDEV